MENIVIFLISLYIFSIAFCAMTVGRGEVTFDNGKKAGFLAKVILVLAPGVNTALMAMIIWKVVTNLFNEL